MKTFHTKTTSRVCEERADGATGDRDQAHSTLINILNVSSPDSIKVLLLLLLHKTKSLSGMLPYFASIIILWCHACFMCGCEAGLWADML